MTKDDKARAIYRAAITVLWEAFQSAHTRSCVMAFELHWDLPILIASPLYSLPTFRISSFNRPPQKKPVMATIEIPPEPTAPSDGDVLVLTRETFNAEIMTNKIVLVMFYAPWYALVRIRLPRLCGKWRRL